MQALAQCQRLHGGDALRVSLHVMCMAAAQMQVHPREYNGSPW